MLLIEYTDNEETKQILIKLPLLSGVSKFIKTAEKLNPQINSQQTIDLQSIIKAFNHIYQTIKTSQAGGGYERGDFMIKEDNPVEEEQQKQTENTEVEEEIVGITRSGEVFKMKVKRKKGKSIFDAPDYCGL